MKKLFCFIILIIISTGCAYPPSAGYTRHQSGWNYEQAIDGQLDNLAKQIARQLSMRKIRGVAVKGFTDLDGQTGDLEKYMNLELTDRLHKTGRFRVIEREELEKFGEKSLVGELEEKVGEEVEEEVKEISTEDVKTIGRLLQVDSIVIGKTVDMPNAIKANVKMISTRTGAVTAVMSVLIRKDRTVRSLLSKDKSYGVGEVKTSDGLAKTGEYITVGENQFYDLVPERYTLYVMRAFYQFDPFAEEESNAEIYLNDEFKILGINEMINFTVDGEKYVLTLKKVGNRMAVFSFARLKTGTGAIQPPPGNGPQPQGGGAPGGGPQ